MLKFTKINKEIQVKYLPKRVNHLMKFPLNMPTKAEEQASDVLNAVFLSAVHCPSTTIFQIG